MRYLSIWIRRRGFLVLWSGPIRNFLLWICWALTTRKRHAGQTKGRRESPAFPVRCLSPRLSIIAAGESPKI